MTRSDTLFTGSIPATYDRYLGPLLFEPYARDLAQRVAALEPRRILETAAGTGIVTAAIHYQLPDAEIVATDLNPDMLEIAAAKADAPNIVLRKADAQQLPFPDASFDAIVCQFGVMFFPDRIGAYREARRVLAPDGRFLFNVWNSLEDNPISGSIAELLADLFPDDPPEFLARTPFGYHDLARIEADLREAGFSEVAAETVTKISRAPPPAMRRSASARARRCMPRSRPVRPAASRKSPMPLLSRSPALAARTASKRRCRRSVISAGG